MYIFQNMMLAQNSYEALAAKRKALSEGGNQRALSEVEKEMDLFLKKHGRGFMFKGLAPMFFFQIPLFITAYASFRGFAMHPWMFQSTFFLKAKRNLNSER